MATLRLEWLLTKGGMSWAVVGLLMALLQPQLLVSSVGAASQPSPAKREPRGLGGNPVSRATPACVIY